MQYRLTDLLEKRDLGVKVSYDQRWPTDLSYENPIVGAMHNRNDISFNFITDDKRISTYPCTDIELSRVVLPVLKNPVAKIRTFVYKD